MNRTGEKKRFKKVINGGYLSIDVRCLKKYLISLLLFPINDKFLNFISCVKKTKTFLFHL